MILPVSALYRTNYIGSTERGNLYLQSPFPGVLNNIFKLPGDSILNPISAALTISPPIQTRFISLTPTAATITSIQDAPQHHNTRAGFQCEAPTELPGLAPLGFSVLRLDVRLVEQLPIDRI